MIMAFCKWFTVDKSRVQGIPNWGYFYIPPTKHLLLMEYIYTTQENTSQFIGHLAYQLVS